LCAGGERRRCRKDDADIDNQGQIRRWRTVEALYEGRWTEVEVPHCQALPFSHLPGMPAPWQHALPDHGDLWQQAVETFSKGK